MIKHVKFKPLKEIINLIKQRLEHKKGENLEKTTIDNTANNDVVDKNQAKTEKKYGKFQFFKGIRNIIKKCKRKKNKDFGTITKNTKEQENLQINYSVQNITNRLLKKPLEIDLDDILKGLEVKDEFIEEMEIERLSNMVNGIIQYDTDNTTTDTRNPKKLVNARKYEKDDLDDLLEELTAPKTPKLDKHT